MAFEGIIMNAVIARLANAEIHLAAYGGVVYPVAVILETPVIMLLAASTALCKDWNAYHRIWKFMMVIGGIITGLHILLAFTPLFDLMLLQLIGAPAEILEPARWGMMMMVPWTWSIGFRRFQQGVMIRSGKSEYVGKGTIVRLLTDVIFLAVGYWIQVIPGVIVATVAQAAGVIAEAIYAGIAVKPIVKYQVRAAEPMPWIGWRAFAAFYIPLALTSFLTFFWQPIGSAAISRMYRPLESLAVWPVVSSILFIFRSIGLAFNEVVVAMLDHKGSYHSLMRFTIFLSVFTSATYLLMGIPPIARWWFADVSALDPGLTAMAQTAYLWAFPMAAVAAVQSWFQGTLVYGRQTRGIPESVGVYLLVVLIILGIGMAQKDRVGLYLVMMSSSLATIVQLAWLWFRTRGILASLKLRDSQVG